MTTSWMPLSFCETPFGRNLHNLGLSTIRHRLGVIYILHFGRSGPIHNMTMRESLPSRVHLVLT